MIDPLHSSNGNSFPGVKQGQLEANQCAFNAMVKNEWSCASSLSVGLRLDALHKQSNTSGPD